MKLIYIIADTLRRDHVSVYGCAPWGKIHTPNLARFAEEAAVFDQAYIGSFPTGPNRRDTLIGATSEGVAFNQWTPLSPDEDTFLKCLSDKGIPSMLITDTQNTVTNKMNAYRDFTAWTVNRGQEGDPSWLDDTVPLEFPVPHELIRYSAQKWHQILMNRAHRRDEIDWFAPKTYSIAMDWLERNYKRDDFFLWIDTFDPHEPWDPPQHYIDRYDPGYQGRVIEAPPGGFRKAMGITPRELKHTRARYAGEVTMVDAWFGRFVSKLEELGIMDETIVIFTSDHGTPLAGPGDFDLMRKPPIIGADGMFASAGRPAPEPRQYVPLAINTVRIPLIIRLPGMQKTKRLNAIVQPWDVTATILDAFDISLPDSVIGESALPFTSGKKTTARRAAICGNNTLAQATTSRWMYSVWTGQREPSLYDLKNDPNCRKNLARKEAVMATRLHREIVSFMQEQGLDGDYIGTFR